MGVFTAGVGCAKLELKDSERPKIDPKFEEVTEGEEIERKEKLKTKWAQLEAVVGSENRNRAIETAQVIEELIGLAKDLRSAHARGEVLGLSRLKFCAKSGQPEFCPWKKGNIMRLVI